VTLLRITALAIAAWAALLLTGCAAGRFLVGAPSDREIAAHRSELLARRCSGCHEIPDPSQMTGAEWRASLTSMRRRMHLPESEWDSLAAMGRADAGP